MKKSIIIAAAATVFALNVGVSNAAQKPIDNLKKFTTEFCKSLSVSPLEEKIFIVSSSIFASEEQTISCDKNGDYKITKAELKNDPGHYAFEVDPTKIVTTGYDCDAKADVGMKFIGLNCLPITKEAAEHKKV